MTIMTLKRPTRNWAAPSKLTVSSTTCPVHLPRADLLICRSGASTVAEVTAAGKPAVFVPFPRAADDHQKRNAEALERAGAAVMLEESKLTSESLVEAVSTLFTDPIRLERDGRRGPQTIASECRARHSGHGSPAGRKKK